MTKVLLYLTASSLCAAQTIDTVVGTGEYGFAGDGGRASHALVTDARSLTVDAAGNLYFIDHDVNRVRRVVGGQIQTIAGSGEIGSATEGSALQSSFFTLHGLSVAPDGRLFIAHGEGMHQMANGQLKTVISGEAVPAVEAANGAIYVADHVRVARLGDDGALVNLTDVGPGDEGDGGPAALAKLSPAAIATDRLGRIWVADAVSHRIRVFTPGGGIRTAAGNGTAGYAGDGGPAVNALLERPADLAVDVAGNVYVADSGNLRVRRINAADGTIETVAGSGEPGTSGDGGAATAATFLGISSVAVSCEGLYMNDLARVRMVRLNEPLLALNGVMDAETGATMQVRPAKRFTITGCQFAASAAAAPAGDVLPTLLNGVEVRVNGVPAGLVAVGPERIEAMLPAGVLMPGDATLTVITAKKTMSAAVMVR